jgi:hypothetical protein
MMDVGTACKLRFFESHWLGLGLRLMYQNRSLVANPSQLLKANCEGR